MKQMKPAMADDHHIAMAGLLLLAVLELITAQEAPSRNY